MDRQIQILILDDEASDAALVERELRKAGIDFRAKCVQDKRASFRLWMISLPTWFFPTIPCRGLTV